MTWSIVVRDADTGAFGVGIATRFFAVGALCLHAESGVGALSTQALMNPHYGPQGLALLREGVPADEVVRHLTTPDEGSEHRQLHVIDSAGRVSRHTGASCVDWCGSLAREGFSVAGNMLAGASVVEDTALAAICPRRVGARSARRRPRPTCSAPMKSAAMSFRA